MPRAIDRGNRIEDLLLELTLLLLDLVDDPEWCGNGASEGAVYLLQSRQDRRDVESELRVRRPDRGNAQDHDPDSSREQFP